MKRNKTQNGQFESQNVKLSNFLGRRLVKNLFSKSGQQFDFDYENVKWNIFENISNFD